MRPVLRVLRILGLALLWPLRAVAWLLDHLLVHSHVGYQGYLERRVEERRLQRTFDEQRERRRHDRAP